MARAFVLPLLLINAASAVVPPPSARPAPCRGLAGAPALRHGWGAAFLSPPPSQLMRRPIGVLDRVEGIGQGATKGRPLVGGRSGGAVRWIGGRRGFGSDVVGRGDRVAQRMLTAQDFQVSSTQAMCRRWFNLWLMRPSAQFADTPSRKNSLRFPSGHPVRHTAMS